MAQNWLSGLVIAACGNIPGSTHDDIERMVEECGAKFAAMDISDCTHLVTTQHDVDRGAKKVIEAGSVSGCQIVSVGWLHKAMKNNQSQKAGKFQLHPIRTSLKKAPEPSAVKQSKKRGLDSDAEGGGDESRSTKKPRFVQTVSLKVRTAIVDRSYSGDS
ncbi:hypothetical protein NUU61_001818 [Penicillium alfredii]|uniref:BRCT domain-containing protein n=1 Tax=Penicillium alfredii TaxID=1506179 RepID=A0A9W9FQE6_9EURO|nr:uncharacterized protein NUU61_001818 [Penicillium alfredii]KAJ5104471.1 hypothetical protein NUU61_001818 [Penicillium alfredii]